MVQIGFDALNVGERELAGGIEEFLAAIAKLELPFVNANFVYRDTGEQLFAPYVIRDYRLSGGRSVKVGYLGLDGLNSAFAKEGPGKRVVIMRNPAEALRLHLPALRKKVDLVVVLASMSLRDLTTALSGQQGVDLVLAGQGPRLSPGGALEQVAGVPVLYAGDQGKRMGEVRISLPKQAGPPGLVGSQVWLTRRYPADPALQGLIDRTIARVNDINRQAAEKTAGAAVSSRRPAGVPGAAGPHPLTATASTGGETSYVTATACADCHQEAYEIYQQSAHAHALETLVKASQDFNPECVKCHVTGFDQPGGFVNARATPNLANVQCEACHGSASGHLADLTHPFGDVPPRSCFPCHTKENSPEFVFFKYWDKIKH